MVQCNIVFDNNTQGIYYSGQTLSGVVELNNEKARNIRGLSLRVEGFAKCKWTESEGSGKHRRSVSYHGREDYINTFSYLIGNSTVNQMELSAGVHKFNFACQLPPQLPTSFESKYGYIRYQIKVELERPWKFDLKFCFAFTVIKILDLNYESPALRHPLKTETTKTFFFGLSGKPLFISAEIPFSGYVSGQTVPISVNIVNDSSTDVEETQVCLKKIIHYNSQSPRRKTRERIESAAVTAHPGVPSKAKAKIDARLNLPPVPPTNIAFCQVIQVTYEIHVIARVGGIHRNPVLRLPITIGTVPLQALQNGPSTNIYFSNWNVQPSTSNAAASAPYPLREAPSAPAPQDLPPPSYAQAMKMGETEGDNDDGLNEEKPFSPMYPIFNFGSTPMAPTSDQSAPPSYDFSNSNFSPPHLPPKIGFNEKQGF